MNKLFTLLLLGLSLSAQSQFVDFESFDIEIDTFLNGSDLLGTFEEDFAILPNSFDTTFSSWSGWSISSMRDTTTPGFMNQYSAITGGGFGSSQNYAVSFSSSGNQIKLDSAYQGRTLAGMYITNSTYAYLSMLDGDAFAKKFGGETGEDPDFFLLTIKGFINGAMTTDSIDFYLADFRFEDNSQDYIVDAWTFVDLSPLGAVDSLSFSLTSSDVGDFGMNTPAYFCMDKVELAPVDNPIADFENLTVPQDSFLNGSDLNGGFVSGDYFFPNSFDTAFSSWTGWAISNTTDTTTPGFMNQYSAITGVGVDNTPTYGVSFSFSPNTIRLDSSAAGQPVSGLYLTNSTYAYLSMLEGDAFAKKFGGETGDDPDFFLLTIKGFFNGEASTDSIDFYLADYRFEDNSLDYIIDEWTYIDLGELGPVDSLSFALSSSDVGDFGMNTPAYFCVDQVGAEQLTTGLFTSVPQRLSFNIFPNPSTDYIQIDQAQPVSYQIFDLQGRQLASPTRLIPGESISVSHLPQGNYFLQVQEGEKLGGGWFSKR